MAHIGQHLGVEREAAIPSVAIKRRTDFSQWPHLDELTLLEMEFLARCTAEATRDVRVGR